MFLFLITLICNLILHIQNKDILMIQFTKKKKIKYAQEKSNMCTPNLNSQTGPGS